MADIIQKLRPDRDLQCFYLEPSAIAALSNTSENGFTLSGTWRQQFDWAVVEWNRDNVYEHPAFRYLPDGDLSRLVLTYEEARSNCIPLDSNLYATVDWPSLRIWITGQNDPFYVPLKSHATPIEGGYQDAYADFTLSGSGTPIAGTCLGVAYMETHYTCFFDGTNSVDSALNYIVTLINKRPNPFQPMVLTATVAGSTIRIFYAGSDPANHPEGANGNRFGMYTYSTVPGVTWDAEAKTFANGTSPTKWQVTLNFRSLQVYSDNSFTTLVSNFAPNQIRKLRWTYAADLQEGPFERSEFRVTVSNWVVIGTNRNYSIAGPGSRRAEDHSTEIVYNSTNSWTEVRGNFSGGAIRYSTTEGDSVTWNYLATQSHTLYLGTRYLENGAFISIEVDGVAASTVNLLIPQEDVLVRLYVGEYAAGNHSVRVAHAGPSRSFFYFDFFELAIPTTDLPTFLPEPQYTLATDWDTLHSISIAPERTAWLIHSLGFTGRQNHYAGALWFYELVPVGYTYASGTVTFAGSLSVPKDDTSHAVTVTIGRDDSSQVASFNKTLHPGDTPETLAIAFAEEINNGSTGVWASTPSGTLMITSRSIGSDGNHYTLSVTSTNNPNLTITVSGTLTSGVYPFTGGQDGNWRTDLTASPKLNRAARDWSLSFFTALKNYGIDSTVSFSMELGNGDPSASAGIAQRDPSGNAIVLPTPSLQTNFSPASLAFWQEVYAEMAAIQATAGLIPFLQFGEVQWWYFPNNGLYLSDPGYVAFAGMSYYDVWTQSQFKTQYGRTMTTFADNSANPSDYPDESTFLSSLIGNFTNSIMIYVRASQPSCRFEVLYPLDVNQTRFNAAVNYPTTAWTLSALNALKTECFGFTLGRDLTQSEAAINFGQALGFPSSQRSHLVGVGDSTTAWLKEARIASGKGFESVVLFALDQYCLIGYSTPLPPGFRRSLKMGN